MERGGTHASQEVFALLGATNRRRARARRPRTQPPAPGDGPGRRRHQDAARDDARSRRTPAGSRRTERRGLLRDQRAPARSTSRRTAGGGAVTTGPDSRSSIFGEGHTFTTNNYFWEHLHRQRSPPVGVCEAKLHHGDQLLFAAVPRRARVSDRDRAAARERRPPVQRQGRVLRRSRAAPSRSPALCEVAWQDGKDQLAGSRADVEHAGTAFTPAGPLRPRRARHVTVTS